MSEPINYQTLHLPAARCEVRFARIGAHEPVIDLRSLFNALGMGWDRWHACAVLAGLQHGMQLLVERDASGRATRLVWASQVPKLIEQMLPSVGHLHPAAARRMSRLSGEWGTNWGRSVAASAFHAPVNAGDGEARPSGAALGSVRSYRLIPKPPVVRITREVEAEVLKLTAQGLRGAEISRTLGISAASVCLLKKGKFRFAASEAARPRLVPKLATRRKREPAKTAAAHA